MDRRSVVWITNWFDNPYMEAMISHLAKQGVDVELCGWSLIFAPQILRKRVDLVHLHLLTDYLPGRNRWIAIAKLILFVSQLLLLRLAGIPTVWTVHEWLDKLADGKHNLSPLQSQIVGKFLAAIIVHCQSTGHEIEREFKLENQGKVFVIPHGNYIQNYKNTIQSTAARQKLGISADQTVFLLFGAIYRYKRFVETIAAFKTLPNPENLHLLVAGKAGELDLADQIVAEIGDRPNIQFFHERIPEADVQLYFNASDYVLLPYGTFTTSGVAVLAMSFARACIAPKTGFFGDVFAESGAIFYAPDDPEGLRTALQTAVERRSEARQMGDRNFQQAQVWNWDFVAEKTDQVYRQLK